MEDDPPKLQPFRENRATRDECWKFYKCHEVELAAFRDRLATWLLASYDDPDRYLETIPDRYAAGLPDRLEPPELLEHNGVKGRERYDTDCADRRAWTWEVRIAGKLDFTHVQALHVPFDILPRAGVLARALERASPAPCRKSRRCPRTDRRITTHCTKTLDACGGS